jgi:hypothetical protein
MLSTLVAVLAPFLFATSGSPPSEGATVPPPPALRVAVLGDSTSQIADRDRPFDSWPEQLGRMLGRRSEVVNCSRTGTRLDPSMPRFVVNMPEFRKAEDARADIVLVALGGSDFAIADGADPAVMRAGLEAVVEALGSFRPEPRIFICLPPPALNAGRRGPMYLAARASNQETFRQFANERGLGFLDLGEPFLGQDASRGELPIPSADDATSIASHVFRAITGRDPVEGSGPFRESLDLESFERRTLVEGGMARSAVPGWSAGSGDSAGFLVSGPEAEPFLMEGAIPEGPFRMRWRLRWYAADSMAEKGGPMLGTGNNLLWLDNRNATMMLTGRDVRGIPELPATARTAPQGAMLDIELRRGQGVVEWLVGGQVLHQAAGQPKALAQAGVRPLGGRVELESWTLDVPKPDP